MSDLISRQALLNSLETAKSTCRGLHEYVFFDAIMAIVDAQSTAYDVDKVVEQLREQDDTCTSCKHKECGWCSIGERIKIVKGGGLE